MFQSTRFSSISRVTSLSGTEDVEVAPLEGLEEEVGDLLGEPGAGGLLLDEALDHAGVGEAGNEQMRRDAAFGLLEQRVREAFGEALDAALAHVVRGIARRLGDALLRAGVDDEARPITRHHVGHEALDAMDHAEEIHAEHAPPPFRIREGVAAAAGPRVVHQHGDGPELGGHRARERVDGRGIGDVRDVRDDLARGGESFDRGLQRLLVEIGQTNAQPGARQALGGGEADSAGAAGHDGDVALREGGVDGGGHGGLLRGLRRELRRVDRGRRGIVTLTMLN